MATAAVLSTALSIGRLRALPRPGRFDVGLAAALALLTLGGNLASAEAIRTLSPALLTLVQRSEVVLAALLAWPLLGERVDRRFWIGAAVAGIGLWLQQQPVAFGRLAGSGVAWALAAAVCFSAMAVLTRRTIHRIDPVAVNGLRLWLSVLFWFALYGLPAELSRISAEQCGWAALAAVCGPFGGRLCMMIAARHLEVRLLTLCLLLSPILTLVLAWALLAELPAGRELLGGAVMLVGISIPVVAALRAGSVGPVPPSGR